MFLSRLILNPRSRRAQRELANPYELHRTLMKGYPDDLDIPEEERVLFRVESDRRTRLPRVLVQSFNKPDWTHLTNRANFILPQEACPPGIRANPSVKRFGLTFTAGQVLSFRLLANPTVKRDGSRHGLYDAEEQRQWLTRKADLGGFQIVRVAMNGAGNITAKVSGRGTRHKATFYAVQFDGVLQVTEPDTMWETVKTGIGPAKGFGFGLLSLAPGR
jgi:CRISPR system Cascade subunit CasE